MQTAAKTPRLLAEEVAQTFIDGSDREIRNCIKHHGRVLTRRLLVALHLAAHDRAVPDFKTMALSCVEAFSALDTKKLDALVRVLDK